MEVLFLRRLHAHYLGAHNLMLPLNPPIFFKGEIYYLEINFFSDIMIIIQT